MRPTANAGNQLPLPPAACVRLKAATIIEGFRQRPGADGIGRLISNRSAVAGGGEGIL